MCSLTWVPSLNLHIYILAGHVPDRRWKESCGRGSTNMRGIFTSILFVKKA